MSCPLEFPVPCMSCEFHLSPCVYVPWRNTDLAVKLSRNGKWAGPGSLIAPASESHLVQKPLYSECKMEWAPESRRNSVQQHSPFRSTQVCRIGQPLRGQMGSHVARVSMFLLNINSGPLVSVGEWFLGLPVDAKIWKPESFTLWHQKPSAPAGSASMEVQGWRYDRPVFVVSRVRIFGTQWTGAHQAPLATGISKQEYWRRLPFSFPGDLPNQGSDLRLLRLLRYVPGMVLGAWGAPVLGTQKPSLWKLV